MRNKRRYSDSFDVDQDWKNALDTAFEEGYAEGYAEGFAKGYAEGYAEAKAKIAQKMKQAGEPVALIVNVTGLTEAEVNLL